MKTSSTLVKSLVAILLFFVAGVSSNLYAQAPACASGQCTSNDLQITRVYFVDAVGNEIPQCTSAAQSVTAYLAFDVKANAGRTGMYFYGEVKVGGVLAGAVSNCFSTDFPNSTTTPVKWIPSQYPGAPSFNFNCGQAVSLDNVYLAWGSGNSQYCPGTCASPKCWRQGSQVILVEYCSPPTGNTTVCVGSTTALSTNSTVASWTSSVTGVATVSSTGVVSGVSSGTTVITFTTTTGCTASTTVTVVGRPTASISSANTSVCTGGSTNITGNVTSAGTWTVTLSNGATATGSGNSSFSIPVSPSGNTTYTITSLVNSNGCSAQPAGLTGATLITVTSGPSISISGGSSSNTSACSNAPVTVGGVSFAGGTIAWTIQSGTGSITSGVNSGSPVFTPAGAGTTVLLATVTGTGACSSASANATYTINVTAAPTLTIGGGSASSTVTCSNAPISVTAVAGGSAGAITWSLQGPGSLNTTSGATVIFTPGAAGTSTLTASSNGTNACGSASASATYTINVTAAPTVTVGGNASSTVCAGNAATVSGVSFNNGSIVWSHNGAGSITAGQGTVAPIYTSAAGDAGNTVTLTATVTGTSACSAATAVATYNVNVLALPGTPTTTGNQFFCSNQAPTVASLSAIGTSIKWYAASTGGAALATSTPLVNGATYWASQTNVNGCESATRTSTTVTITACLSTFIIDRIDPICPGQSNGSIHIQLTGGGTAPFQISFDEGKTYEPVAANGRIDKYGLPAGIYNIFLKHGDGLVQPLSTTTLIDPKPVTANINTVGAITCSNNSVTLNVSDIKGGNGAPYTISLDGGAFGSATSFTVGAGVHTITIRDKNGCTWVAGTVNVAAPAAISLNTVVTNVSTAGGSNGAINLTVAGGSNSYMVTLTRQNGSSTVVNAGNNTVTFNNLPAGTYRISVTDNNGCGTVSRTVNVGEAAAGALPPDLILGSESSSNNFALTPSVINILYNIVNVSPSGNASGVVLRVSKPAPGYTVELGSGAQYTTTTGVTYTLDNARWSKTADNDSYVEFSLNADPNGQNIIPAQTFTAKRILVIATRTASATGKGTLTITGTVRSSQPDNFAQDNATVHVYSAQ